jgi:integral membrane protein
MPKWFLTVGRLEGVSFLVLLLIAMPLKYYASFPSLVKLMGPVHGFLFIIYLLAAIFLATSQDWSYKKRLFAFLAAVFPCGTFMFEKKYR